MNAAETKADLGPLLLMLHGSAYEVELLPPGPLRRRVVLQRQYARSRRYVVEQAQSGWAACECRGFLTHGHCKHVEGLKTVGLLGVEASAPGA